MWLVIMDGLFRLGYAAGLFALFFVLALWWRLGRLVLLVAVLAAAAAAGRSRGSRGDPRLLRVYRDVI